MSYTTRDLQARLTSLGYNPGVIDGMKGRNTRKAANNALNDRGLKYQSDLFDKSGLHRVHWHWAASSYNVSEELCSHYNGVSDHEGNHHEGGARPEHQADYRAGRVGVSHTLNGNTGAIGEAVTGMHGSSDYPFSWGDYPLTWAAIDMMLEKTAQHCHDFDIPVSRTSTLSHAEIQTTLGIRQNAKWDFMVLPGMDKVWDPVSIGDALRERLLRFL